MGVTTNLINKPFNPRAQDQSPKGYNRASLFSGKALDFDGVNDSVTATGSNTLSFSAITLSAYFKFDNLGATQVIFAKRKDVAGYWSAAFIMSSSGELDFRTTTGTTEYKAVYSDFVTGEYYHVVGINDGSNNYLYVNGQLVDTTASGAIDNTTTYDFVLGNNATGQYYYNGQLSNVKVYSTALTAAQVADLYNNPEKVVPTGLESNLKLWLPMMEGAGTTAYDGSGNGNHGTISGATYVNGIGAPVAQSAVIDWNKGTNKLTNSSNLGDVTNWNRDGDTAIESGYSAPDGTNTAYKVSTIDSTARLVQQNVTDADDYRAIWARTTSGTGDVNLLSNNGNTNNLFTITEEWQKFSVNSAPASGEVIFYAVDFRGSGTLNEVVLWQPHCADSESVLIPTLATAQTSEVLLPQGLTTGRDITGVNLFENVRKQGALNLDGNSWAEVHDNASLDIGDFSMEAWVRFKKNGNYQVFFAKDDSSSDRSYELGLDVSQTNFFANVFGTGNGYTTSTIEDNVWYHLVSTFDISANDLNHYINGVLNRNFTLSETQSNTDAPLIIGGWYDKTNFLTNGQIAQPRIYNRALTAEEVQRNYNAGKNTYTN